jgi:hypothetical protein
MHVVVLVISRIHTSVRIQQVSLPVLLAVLERPGVYGPVLVYIPALSVHTTILGVILAVISDRGEHLSQI